MGLAFTPERGGTGAQILRHRANLTQLRLPSRKEIWVNSWLTGLIGLNLHSKSKHQRLNKAGDLKFIGRRPVVRGVAMNPVDHPHGGGQGKTSGGQPAVSPWGQLCKGYRTKRKK